MSDLITNEYGWPRFRRRRPPRKALGALGAVAALLSVSVYLLATDRPAPPTPGAELDPRPATTRTTARELSESDRPAVLPFSLRASKTTATAGPAAPSSAGDADSGTGAKPGAVEADRAEADDGDPVTPAVTPAPAPASAPAPPRAADGATTVTVTAPPAADTRALLIADGLENGALKMVMNKSTVLVTRAPYRRVSVGAPDVADVNPIGPNNILVTARKPGATQLVVWDDADRSQVLDVAVNVDLNALREQFKQMFPGAKIEVSTAQNAVVLRGQVASAVIAEQAAQIAQPYAARVLNFLEVSGGQQVMLQVRFAEVSKSATNQLGVNFGLTDGRSFFGNTIGQVAPFTVKELDGGGTALATPGANPAISLFGRGVWGQVAFDYYISALRQNNLLRVLAEPNLVAVSGQEASFLAGGEFPIPVTQGGGTGAGGTAITVEYRSFGVKLNFVPVILGDGRIRLKVAPEVSDLDFTTAVRFNGFVIPGLSQRKLQTVVEVGEGQTIALAGLLSNNVSATKDVTPVLGDIPVVGALFRSVRYQRKETELVVIVTPRLVQGMNPAQVPLLPGERWRHPTEGELFWNRDLGGTAGDPNRAARADGAPASLERGGAAPGPSPRADGAPPLFRGEYGFVPAGDAED